jgi:hypothetical protein
MDCKSDGKREHGMLSNAIDVTCNDVLLHVRLASTFQFPGTCASEEELCRDFVAISESARPNRGLFVF